MADIKVVVGVVESSECVGAARVLRQEFAVFVFSGVLCGSHEEQVLQEMGQSLQVFLLDTTANKRVSEWNSSGLVTEKEAERGRLREKIQSPAHDQ